MNREQRMDESIRLMVTAFAYVIAAAACIVISIVHVVNRSMGWATIMWLLGMALTAMSLYAKRESVRIFPEIETNDDD